MKRYFSIAVLMLFGMAAIGSQLAFEMGPKDQFVIFHRPGPKWDTQADFFHQPGIGAHVAHYMILRQEGRLFSGGPFLDSSGGMMIATPGQKLAELTAFASSDPAVKSGVLTFEIKPWRTGMKAGEIKYYYGSANTLSPDGSKVYESSFSLVKRVVSPEDETIFEDVIQPSEDPAKPGTEFLVTMQRIGNSPNFQVTEKNGVFAGEMDFSGPEWAWDQWEYKIGIPGGGKMSGAGKVDASGVHTQKVYFGKEGTAQAKIVEELSPIELSEYLRRRKEIMKE